MRGSVFRASSPMQVRSVANFLQAITLRLQARARSPKASWIVKYYSKQNSNKRYLRLFVRILVQEQNTGSVLSKLGEINILLTGRSMGFMLDTLLTHSLTDFRYMRSGMLVRTPAPSPESLSQPQAPRWAIRSNIVRASQRIWKVPPLFF